MKRLPLLLIILLSFISCKFNSNNSELLHKHGEPYSSKNWAFSDVTIDQYIALRSKGMSDIRKENLVPDTDPRHIALEQDIIRVDTLKRKIPRDLIIYQGQS